MCSLGKIIWCYERIVQWQSGTNEHTNHGKIKYTINDKKIPVLYLGHALMEGLPLSFLAASSSHQCPVLWVRH